MIRLSCELLNFQFAYRPHVADIATQTIPQPFFYGYFSLFFFDNLLFPSCPLISISSKFPTLGGFISSIFSIFLSFSYVLFHFIYSTFSSLYFIYFELFYIFPFLIYLNLKQKYLKCMLMLIYVDFSRMFCWEYQQQYKQASTQLCAVKKIWLPDAFFA